MARYDRPCSRRRPARRSGLAGLAALALMSGGCTALDDLLATIPVFSFMRDTPMIEPYEMPRPAPVGSVPFQSPAGELLPMIEPTEVALIEFGELTPNPVPLTDQVLQAGAVAYANHCAVCHGPQGLGDGPIIRPGAFPFAPDLTAPPATERTDGYLYGIIRVGRGLMAGYGDRINHWERWYLVHYMRHLQGQAEAAPAEEGAPEPGPDPPGPQEGPATGPDEMPAVDARSPSAGTMPAGRE